MRIVELCLERYDRFEDCRLPMRDGAPDFHIIYGANEAGKSTTLAAVSDFMFGIPQRSPYNFRFDYALMRIGAIIEEDGRRFACRRRKTREQSLVDPAIIRSTKAHSSLCSMASPARHSARASVSTRPASGVAGKQW